MDKNYWEEYYKEQRLANEPSKFALYVTENFIDITNNPKLIELFRLDQIKEKKL